MTSDFRRSEVPSQRGLDLKTNGHHDDRKVTKPRLTDVVTHDGNEPPNDGHDDRIKSLPAPIADSKKCTRIDQRRQRLVSGRRTEYGRGYGEPRCEASLRLHISRRKPLRAADTSSNEEEYKCGDCDVASIASLKRQRQVVVSYRDDICGKYPPLLSRKLSPSQQQFDLPGCQAPSSPASHSHRGGSRTTERTKFFFDQKISHIRQLMDISRGE
ncbi:unnamed protein product [Soboliphyme baturini]|uniref:Uncharacterized protein n=1 Tax=Soboliphyme baturini TaxID=241478 RepID=A0A183J423_9BILA|nr:unnamed protein product [Soboliphyme baturini]